MPSYHFRVGDGNEGNYRTGVIVELDPTDCPFSALSALVVNRYVQGATRRYIVREIQTEGEPEYGISAWVSEGPEGEQAFGAAWITAELEPTDQPGEPLESILDRSAWRQYCRDFRAHRHRL